MSLWSLWYILFQVLDANRDYSQMKELYEIHRQEILCGCVWLVFWCLHSTSFCKHLPYSASPTVQTAHISICIPPVGGYWNCSLSPNCTRLHLYTPVTGGYIGLAVSVVISKLCIHSNISGGGGYLLLHCLTQSQAPVAWNVVCKVNQKTVFCWHRLHFKAPFTMSDAVQWQNEWQFMLHGLNDVV